MFAMNSAHDTSEIVMHTVFSFVEFPSDDRFCSLMLSKCRQMLHIVPHVPCMRLAHMQRQDA